MPCTTCGNLGPQHYAVGEVCYNGSPGGVTGPFGCPKPSTSGWPWSGGRKKSRKSRKSKKSKKSRKSRK